MAVDSQGTASRHQAVLECIPKYPHKISTTTLLQKLVERGYRIDRRTLQRDLQDKIVPDNPIICYDDTSPYRYGLMKGAKLESKSLDTQTALALDLAHEHLKKILPQSTLDLLAPQFVAAERHIEKNSNNRLSAWKKRVRAMPNGKALIPAELECVTWEHVSTALLDKKQLEVTYQGTQSELKYWRIHPQGLVSRHSASYLIATINEYKDFRILALHRIKNSQVLDDECVQCSDESINDYIDSGALGWGAPVSSKLDIEVVKPENKELTLVADVAPYTASVLKETALSKDQTLEPITGSDWLRLTATVPNNKETLWWVFGLNANIKLHEPVEWVAEIKTNIEKVLGMYDDLVPFQENEYKVLEG